MLNLLKLLHIAAVAILSVSYTCFVIQLSSSEIVVYLLLTLYCVQLFLYSLQTYAAFHSLPTEPNLHTTHFDIGLVFAFKLTQERRRELKQAIRTVHPEKRAELEKQYINEHQKPSFCDICERVQPPRAYHCLECDCCIMGKQKHSYFLGFCIGENNQLSYLLYLLASKLLTFFAFLTLALLHLTAGRFQRLSDFLSIYYLILVFLLALALLAYSREFFLLLTHIQDSKSIAQSEDSCLKNFHPNKSKTSHSYWQILGRLVRVQRLGEQSEWLGEIQEGMEGETE